MLNKIKSMQNDYMEITPIYLFIKEMEEIIGSKPDYSTIVRWLKQGNIIASECTDNETFLSTNQKKPTLHYIYKQIAKRVLICYSDVLGKFITSELATQLSKHYKKFAILPDFTYSVKGIDIGDNSIVLVPPADIFFDKEKEKLNQFKDFFIKLLDEKSEFILMLPRKLISRSTHMKLKKTLFANTRKMIIANLGSSFSLIILQISKESTHDGFESKKRNITIPLDLINLKKPKKSKEPAYENIDSVIKSLSTLESKSPWRFYVDSKKTKYIYESNKSTISHLITLEYPKKKTGKKVILDKHNVDILMNETICYIRQKSRKLFSITKEVQSLLYQLNEAIKHDKDKSKELDCCASLKEELEKHDLTYEYITPLLDSFDSEFKTLLTLPANTIRVKLNLSVIKKGTDIVKLKKILCQSIQDFLEYHSDDIEVIGMFIGEMITNTPYDPSIAIET